MNKEQVINKLWQLHACDEYIQWATDHTGDLEDMLNQTSVSDLAWLARKLEIDEFLTYNRRNIELDFKYFISEIPVFEYLIREQRLRENYLDSLREIPLERWLAASTEDGQ